VISEKVAKEMHFTPIYPCTIKYLQSYSCTLMPYAVFSTH